MTRADLGPRPLHLFTVTATCNLCGHQTAQTDFTHARANDVATDAMLAHVREEHPDAES